MASRILIIGATGYIGRFITKASIALGHPTTILVRESTFSDAQKASLLESFKSSGVSILKGSMDDHETLVKAIKSVDVVISAVGSAQITEQSKIIKAIKEAGNVKRFLPSEFGVDVDRVNAVEPAKSAFALKSKIRREVEAEGIPYTFVCCNFFAGYLIPTLGNFGLQAPPRDKTTVLGDGNVKVVYVKEEDIGTYTIKAVDDPRTLNRVLYLRPPANTLTYNDLVEMWEKKIGKTLEKTYLTEEQIFKAIAGKSILSFILSLLGVIDLCS
eukprot:TRINITY_DN2635_c0_g1_i2.p1 TRINITY_DN2635_c0_g1~~TRINITY_DN2635_c0_g1_i2.p1  ORF type:complete len:271 (+),score=38.40 TRINITY_DN2635_c0_g1_i2:209-1021(+)